LLKQALKKTPRDSLKSLVLEYAVKKPGVYRLQKVVDESNLEVQTPKSDTLVVNCPKAVIKPSTSNRCIGDLSDLTIEVKGTPPMKIVYSRTVNKEDQSFHFQSIQPEHLISPLLGSNAASALVTDFEQDLSWGRSHSIDVRLNESMTTSGKWIYSIDEVHDAAGNVANFSTEREDGEQSNPKQVRLAHSLTVHERPVAQLKGCDTNHPLKVASGVSAIFPVEFGTIGSSPEDTKHTVKWYFSPLDKLTASGDHGEDVIVEVFVSKGPRQKPKISRPGLYTLKSITSQFCEGEVKEPASCLLLNPPEPNLSITSEDIYDKCAGNSIGLLVDLDLTGTPPFVVHYEIEKNKQKKSHKVRVDGLRHQLELKPSDAGHFIYRFEAIDDYVYGYRPLNSQALTLEQDVKPPASAYLRKPPGEITSCIEERIDMKVSLQGEPPFTLEYELIHNGKRKKEKATDIEENTFTISTEPLIQGGDYSLALASVQDKTGCKIFLNDEAKISVRQQRPKASFGLLDGKRKVTALEGEKVKLPLRLEGVPPLHIIYRRINDSSGQIVKIDKQSTNDILQVDQRGVYELVDVADSLCPGSVDASTATFEVDWVPRPEIKLAENAGLTLEGGKYIKSEVCEGDIDAVELSLTGKAVLFGSFPFSTNLDNRISAFSPCV
jgi:nucleoporin POM152